MNQKYAEFAHRLHACLEGVTESQKARRMRFKLSRGIPSGINKSQLMLVNFSIKFIDAINQFNNMRRLI